MDRVGLLIKDFPEGSASEISRKRQTLNRARVLGLDEDNTEHEVIVGEARVDVTKTKDNVAKADLAVLNAEAAVVTAKAQVVLSEDEEVKSQLKVVGSKSNLISAKQSLVVAEAEVVKAKSLYVSARNLLDKLELVPDPNVVKPVLPTPKNKSKKVNKKVVNKSNRKNPIGAKYGNSNKRSNY